MKNYIFILISITTFSCSQNKDNIVEFEKVLGAKETKALDLLVSDFEKNLTKIYPDLSTEKGYTQYLKDLISKPSTNSEKFNFQTDKTNFEFHKSGLWDDIYSKATETGLTINTSGKYIRALFSIKKPDPWIKVYREKKKAVGMMQNELLINGILNSNPNFNNYFHKRIVVIEFSF